MEKDEFPYTYEDALRLMRSSVKDFRDEELRELWRTGAVDWIYIEGEVHFYRRFLSNLMKTRPAYAERSLKPLTPGSAALLNENIRIMKENGGRSARLHLKASLKVETNALQEGRKLRVHLPIPQETAQQVSEPASLAPSRKMACRLPAAPNNELFSGRRSPAEIRNFLWNIHM